MKHVSKKHSLGLAGICICSVALGQTPPSSATTGLNTGPGVARESEILQTVVVTAERRSQSLQTVPISIQAFTAEDLEKRGTASNMDLQMHVPGMVMTENMGFGQIYIRGIGSDIIATGVDNAVAVYVNGVYQSRPMGSMLNFVDVQRVEVLKGPQGTLYGRNATGGAINIVSQAPSRESEGQFDAQFGSLNSRVLRGTVSGPLSPGMAYGRLSIGLNNDDGFVKNTLLNTNGWNNDIQTVRGAIELTPTSALNAVLNAYSYDGKTVPMMKSLNALINPAYTAFRATWIEDPYTVMQNTPGAIQTKQSGADVKIEYDLNWARLTSITATRKDGLYLNVDLDATEVDFVKIGSPARTFGQPEDSSYFSQDFTLASSKKGPLQWTALASFMNQKTDYSSGVQLPLARVVTDSIGTLTTDAMGIGGQASYAVSENIKLTAGTRYSKETKENVGTNYVNGTVTKSQNEQTTWTAWTPKLVAEYTASKDLMLYTSATKGFKSGGYATVSFGPAWLPEKVTNLEAGMKSTWLGGRLLVNATAFSSKYDELQLQYTTRSPVGAIVTVTTNAAKATSSGFEMNFVGKPTARFEVSGGIQVLNAEFDQYITTNPLKPALGAVDQKGNPLLRAPDLTLNFGMQYTWPSAFQGKDVTLRADGYRRSKIYYTAFKDELASEELSFLGNVQLSFEPIDKAGMYGAVFIRNIGNRVYHTDILASATGGYVGYLAPPRTIGVQIGYRY